MTAHGKHEKSLNAGSDIFSAVNWKTNSYEGLGVFSGYYVCRPKICLRSYVPDLADSCYCLCL